LSDQNEAASADHKGSNIACTSCEHNNIKLSNRSYASANAFNDRRQYSSSIVGNIDLKE